MSAVFSGYASNGRFNPELQNFNKVGHYWRSIRKKGKERYDRPRNFYRDIRPRTGCVQVRTGLTGQLNRCQPENYIKLYLPDLPPA